MPLNIRETFPLTHEQAVTILVEANWSPPERVVLCRSSATELHNGAGLALRENWYLTDKTFPLSRHYQRRFGLGHADDMSRLILSDFVARLRKQSYNVEQEACVLRKHWTDQGVDPLTLERSPMRHP
jgi:hypothetical protein